MLVLEDEQFMWNKQVEPINLFLLSPTDKKETGSTLGVGELIEITPVSQAIARHLGIDLSPEGKGSHEAQGTGPGGAWCTPLR